MFETSLVLPFQTSSTSRLSANSRKRNLSRQRLVCFDIAEDFLFFLFGQSRHSIIFTLRRYSRARTVSRSVQGRLRRAIVNDSHTVGAPWRSRVSVAARETSCRNRQSRATR